MDEVCQTGAFVEFETEEGKQEYKEWVLIIERNQQLIDAHSEIEKETSNVSKRMMSGNKF